MSTWPPFAEHSTPLVPTIADYPDGFDASRFTPDLWLYAIPQPGTRIMIRPETGTDTDDVWFRIVRVEIEYMSKPFYVLKLEIDPVQGKS